MLSTGFNKNFIRGHKEMLELRNLQYLLKISDIKKVSRDTGVHYNTLYAIANGKNNNPTYKMVQVLTDYFSVQTEGK